uniref:Uncharacterized protein n=1 Tax=Rhizophagus irregularis (strain DAOM 181602 / DAOM 197198 / MUCL 43194) TaxID=747089 RepID=U9TIG0_RHIID
MGNEQYPGLNHGVLFLYAVANAEESVMLFMERLCAKDLTVGVNSAEIGEN